MAKNNTIIKPALISWARKRLGMTEPDFAWAMKVAPDTVAAWERGNIALTMNQAKKLAALSLLPLGVFFLDSPPSLEPELPDFRTLHPDTLPEGSAELQATIIAMQEKQAWYKAYMLENKLPAPAFVGSLKPQSDIAAAAKHIRKALQLRDDSSATTQNWEEHFSLLLQKTEDAGILVCRNAVVGNNTHRRLDVEEFRGFVLIDEYAPLLFINGNDSKNAQVFTLIHELVHVFLGNSALTDSEMMDAGANPIEQFCNQVAAEFLLPEKQFVKEWKELRANNMEENMLSLSKEFKVSKLVVIKRCQDLRLLPNEQTKELWKKAVDEINAYKNRPKAGGGNFFATLKYRVGVTFAQTVIAETAARRTPFTEAFYLLNVKNIEGLQKLSETLGTCTPG